MRQRWRNCALAPWRNGWADLDCGLDGELVPELSTLVAHYPLRERLRGQLILALYRSGRQADALEAYRETRRVLATPTGQGVEGSPSPRPKSPVPSERLSTL
jgi:DNA-binding SARP family transcriptional activator